MTGLSLAAIVVIAGAGTVQESEPPASTEALARAWKTRENQVRSASFSWKSKLTLVRNSMSVVQRASSEEQRFPDQDTTYESSYRLAFDAGKTRFESSSKAWHADRSELVNQDGVSTFNGQVAKAFSGPGLVAHPTGTILSDPVHPDIHNVENHSLLWCYRGLDPKMGGIRLSDYAMASDWAIISGRKCFALRENPHPKRPGRRTFWVDAGNSYVIRRYTTDVNGKVSLQLDIDYSDNTAAPVPVAWRLVWLGSDGSLRQSGDARVTEHHLNAVIAPEEFDQRFPPGTLVTDQRRPSDLGQRSFFIQRDGDAQRPILRADIGASYQQLLDSEPGKALQVGRLAWLSVALLAAILLLGVLLLRTLIKRRSVSNA